MSNTPPEQATVWPGAMLASIVHAVGVARLSNLSHEQSWDGSNYSVQNSQGSRGTVAFEGARFVAVFFYDDSSRNPFISETGYDMGQLFAGMPGDLESLANNEALQYLLQEVDGRAVPVATAAFWGDGTSKYVAAAESWESAWSHGAVLLENQLKGLADGLKSWQSGYELSAWEVELVKRLWELKSKSPTEPIDLDAGAIAAIKASARGPDGVAASRESFKEIGIILPE